MTEAPQWHIRGEYFENCNCEVLCPCLLPSIQQNPTEGHCDMAFAFHVEEGGFNGVDLNSLNFVVAMSTPGKMSDPNWTMAVYVEQLANPEQRAALGKILSGEIGGPMERWMAQTSNYVGIKIRPDYLQG